MMFGFFTKKKFDFICPMCGGEMNTKLDPADIDGGFEYNSSYDVMSEGSCPFCKLKFVITIHRKNRTAKAFDPKWEKVKYDFEKKEYALEEKQGEASERLQDIDDILDDGDSTDTEINKASKKRPALEKKFDALEAQIEKLQDAFYAKEEKYEDRQFKWQEKFDEKYR